MKTSSTTRLRGRLDKNKKDNGAPKDEEEAERKKPAAVPAAAKPAGGRPPCKVDFTSVERLMHLPQPEAAKALGISLTTLKIVCRTQGLTKWPYRRAGRNGGASRADAGGSVHAGGSGQGSGAGAAVGGRAPTPAVNKEMKQLQSADYAQKVWFSLDSLF